MAARRIERVLTAGLMLGAFGGDASLTALQNLKHRDKDVADAAQRAVERIKMRRTL